MIAQVHRAVLRNGNPVVVKVQCPGIKEVMGRDVAILRKAISLVKLAPDLGDPLDFKVMLEEMWVVVRQEMDFLIEASHLEEFEKLNREIQYVGSPKIEKHLTTSHILVMEYIEGIPIDHKDELLEQGYDLNEIAMKLAANYAKTDKNQFGNYRFGRTAGKNRFHGEQNYSRNYLRRTSNWIKPCLHNRYER